MKQPSGRFLPHRTSPFRREFTVSIVVLKKHLPGVPLNVARWQFEEAFAAVRRGLADIENFEQSSLPGKQQDHYR